MKRAGSAPSDVTPTKEARKGTALDEDGAAHPQASPGHVGSPLSSSRSPSGTARSSSNADATTDAEDFFSLPSYEAAHTDVSSTFPSAAPNPSSNTVTGVDSSFAFSFAIIHALSFAIGLGFSLAFSFAYSFAFTFAFRNVFSIALSLAFGLVFNIAFHLVFGLTFTLAFVPVYKNHDSSPIPSSNCKTNSSPCGPTRTSSCADFSIAFDVKLDPENPDSNPEFRPESSCDCSPGPSSVSSPGSSSDSSPGFRSPSICITTWNNDPSSSPISTDSNFSATSILTTIPATSDTVLCLQDLPEDVLRAIFRLLLEQDLCRVAQVCRRFRDIADDPVLWRRLYKEVFQYDRPLFHPQPCIFEFQSEEGDYSDDNPWKESFRQLYHGVHVRPGYKEREYCGRKIIYFDNVLSALAFTNENVAVINASDQGALIFVHAGFYREEILIDFNVALIGAAAKDVNTSVFLEGKSASTVEITKGADEAYVGHFTLICTTTSDSDFEQNEICSLDISQRCSPIVDNCIIQHRSRCGSAIRVRGRGAHPTIKNCLISDCKSWGVCVHSYAEGTYINNEICGTRLTGILVRYMANPKFIHNIVSNGYEIGISVSGRAMGIFEGVKVYNNRLAALEVLEESTPIVRDCEFMSEEENCVYISERACGLFIGNRLRSNNCPAFRILTGSEPMISRNKIVDSDVGVSMVGSGEAVIEDNEIIGSFSIGIQILNTNPIIRKNKILNGKQLGIYLGDDSQAVIEGNEIASNATTGLWISNVNRTFIRRNCIHSGTDGVYFEFQGQCLVENNSVFNNANYNLIIKSRCSPYIYKNKIWGAGKGGVLISNESLAYLEDNEIFDNSGTGVKIVNNSTCILKRNKIFDGRGYGIGVLRSGIGILEDNDIFRNSDSGVWICTQSNACLRRNRIFCGFAAGMEISHDGTASLKDNQIFSNRFGGLRLATGVQPVLQGNDISGNGDVVEEAVSEGLCLLALSKNTMAIMHNYYTCRTCKAADTNTICENCMAVCHKDHAVSFVRRDKFGCACGAGALGSVCQLQGEPREDPLSFQAVSLEVNQEDD